MKVQISDQAVHDWCSVTPEPSETARLRIAELVRDGRAVHTHQDGSVLWVGRRALPDLVVRCTPTTLTVLSVKHHKCVAWRAVLDYRERIEPNAEEEHARAALLAALTHAQYVEQIDRKLERWSVGPDAGAAWKGVDLVVAPDPLGISHRVVGIYCHRRNVPQHNHD
jgi:hypothetical protein